MSELKGISEYNDICLEALGYDHIIYFLDRFDKDMKDWDSICVELHNVVSSIFTVNTYDDNPNNNVPYYGTFNDFIEHIQHLRSGLQLDWHGINSYEGIAKLELNKDKVFESLKDTIERFKRYHPYMFPYFDIDDLLD